MGAQSNVEGLEAPPQPASWNSSSKSRRDDFQSAYTAVGGGASSGNPFEVFDADLDDAGADSGTWEAEALGARSEARFWQPRFYSAYFDVNAGDVFVRLLRSVFPFKPLLGWAAQEEDNCGGTSVPDLYGPVWVTTTAVLALSVGSSVATFLRNVLSGVETRDVSKSLAGVDFSRLWKVASVLYFYVFVFPVLLTLFQCLFVRRSLRESSVASHPVLGTVMVYGYSMAPVVLAACVATVPLRVVQVSAISSAFLIGSAVIVLNLWRDVSVEHRSLTYVVRFFAGLMHAAVGVGMLALFYL